MIPSVPAGPFGNEPGTMNGDTLLNGDLEINGHRETNGGSTVNGHNDMNGHRQEIDPNPINRHIGTSDHSATNGHSEINNRFQTTHRASNYTLKHQPIHHRRPMRLICIGAGIAGIAAAYKYQRQMENVEFAIYEKNHDVGGTWLENRYPGCACDIPAHGYTYSWEGNPAWSRFYAEAPEIFDYFKGCAVKWDCMRYIKLSHRVIEARWSEQKSGYDIKVENLITGEVMNDFCHILLSATGVLNNWKWPAINGIHNFKGKLLHSAVWDSEYDFRHKTIAVIGAGSSGIQIVPSLQPVVKKMYSFIRSPTWITPEFSESIASEGRETKFSAEQIKRFKTDKQHFLEFRKHVQNTGSTSYPLFYKESEKQKHAFKAFTALMQQRLDHDERLCRTIIPKFEVGCRRFTPGSGFLEALIKPNVEVVTDEMAQITEHGIIDGSGNEYKVDAIVCATGFDCSFRPAFPVIGRNGANLGESWKDGPRHYMSIAAPGFPNYFIVGGPNSPIANGSLIAGLEVEIDYAYKCLRKLQREDIRSLEVTEEAVDEFLEHRDAVMKEMVWSGGCRSWYKNGTVDGPVIGPSVGSTWHFVESLRDPRFEDYKLHYCAKNRFSYMGHGRTIKEIEGGDLASHLTEPGA